MANDHSIGALFGRIKSKPWHLLILFLLGSVIEWAGSGLKNWSGERLKKRWFPSEEQDDG